MINTMESLKRNPQEILTESLKQEYSQTQIMNDNLLKIDFHYVVTGHISSLERDTALQEVDKMLDDVLKLRKSKTAREASDIYLFITAPLNSRDDPSWRNLAIEIERDDRLARKQVWLPNADASNFHELVNSSFLAKPWEAHQQNVAALNIITTALELPKGWRETLLNEELSGESLIEELLSIELSKQALH